MASQEKGRPTQMSRFDPKEKGEPDSEAKASLLQSLLAATGGSRVHSCGIQLEVDLVAPRRAPTVRAFPGAELVSKVHMRRWQKRYLRVVTQVSVRGSAY